MASRSFGSEAPRLGHLVTGKGGVAGEVDDLRGDVDDGFESIEAEIDVIGIRRPVKLATAAALNACTAAGSGVGKTLTQNAAAVENIDGVAVVVGDRILVKNQVAAKDNGIYTVTTVGTVAVKQVLTRATDADSSTQVKGGMFVWVNQGVVNANLLYVLTTDDPITLDTTALVFTELDVAGVKRPVKLATAAALNACTAAGTGVGKTLTQNAAGMEDIDGVAVTVGDRILVKNQVAGKDNGIYTVTTVGTGAVQQVLTRATDADSSAQVKGGMQVWVNQGTANADTVYALTTNDPITLDTTALTFTLQSPPVHTATHIRDGSDEIDGDLLDIDYAETNYAATVTAPATHADHLTAHLAGIDAEMAGMAQDDGCAASAVIIQAGQPNPADTLIIGADTYTFVAAAAAPFEVTIAGTAAGTMTNLITEAQTNGTEQLLWESLSATTAQITSADAAGAAPNVLGADPSIVLNSASATNYSFNTGDVNMNTLAGRAASQQTFAATTLTITTAMTTATLARISFPFAVTSFQITATSSGVPVAFTADTFTIDGNDVVLGLGTDLANGDVVHIVAYA